MPTVKEFFKARDITGTSPANKIVDESHVTANTSYKIIRPKWGAFFLESLTVYSVDSVNNTRVALVKNTDYICTDILVNETYEYGKEINQSILITKALYSTYFDISYQFLGGDTIINVPVLDSTFKEIMYSQKWQWDSILFKPKYFVPGDHLHDSKDVYGMEYFALELERIKDSVVVGRDFAREDIIARLNALDILLLNYFLIDDVKNLFVLNIDVCTYLTNELREKIIHEELKYILASAHFTKARNYFNDLKNTKLNLTKEIEDKEYVLKIDAQVVANNGQTKFIVCTLGRDTFTTMTVVVNGNKASGTIYVPIHNAQEDSIAAHVRMYESDGGDLEAVSQTIFLPWG